MPLRNDLIERTLEQLAEVVRRLMGIHAVQSVAEAKRIIQEAYRQHTGSEGSLLQRLPSEQLIQVLSSAGMIDREKAFLIASLFRAEAKLEEVRGEGQNVQQLNKALDLYLEAALADLDVADVHDYIAELSQDLSSYQLPPETEWRLFDYEVQRGHFAEAEDKLFSLLDQLGANPEVAQRGRAFYKRLQQSSDERLEAGDLPRSEVEEGFRAFEAQFKEGV